MLPAKYHKAVIALIIAITAILSLTNLGGRIFWGDEAHLLNLGRSIVSYGIPVIDDDLKLRAYEVDDITGAQFNGPVPVWLVIGGVRIYTLHPWMVSYISALPIALAGPFSEFCIRLPFVIIGLLALPITYALARRIRDRKAGKGHGYNDIGERQRRNVALLAMALTGFSVVYLLAIRSANYYALLILGVPATLLTYLQMTDGAKGAWWRFGLSAALLFHSQYLVFLSTMLGIAIHALLLHRSWPTIRRFIPGLLLAILLTLPWFIITQQYAKVSVLSTPGQYFLLATEGAVHVLLWMVPLLTLICLPFALLMKWTKGKAKASKFRLSSLLDALHREEGMSLFLLVMASTILFISLNQWSGAPLRYFYGLLPLGMILNAYVIAWIARAPWAAGKWLAAIIVVLLVFTNLVHVVEFLPIKGVALNVAAHTSVVGTGQDEQAQYVQKAFQPRWLMAEYFSELSGRFESVSSRTIDAIGISASPGARDASVFVGVGDPVSIGYYTMARISTYDNNYKTRTYDWILLISSDPRAADLETLETNANDHRGILRYSQENILLDTSRWGDTADPVHHLFQTKADADGAILYKKMSSP